MKENTMEGGHFFMEQKETEYKQYESRKLCELKKGDIIRTRIPFEENTPDYYNGYYPKQIRGRLFRDRFGNTSKPRFVIVVGYDENNIMYLPLTSRHCRCDERHQYTLQDNSMTWKRDSDMKSYVECNSLRAIRINPEWDMQYIGRIEENDMTNIMVKVGKYEIDFESKRDQRAYISKTKEEAFERRLKENGYTLSHKEFESRTYTSDNGRTVTKSRWGLVKYHVPLSKEEVTKLVAKREGKPMDDFTRAIRNITEKSVIEESGVIQ